jgi:hypothetical protein
LIGVRSKERPTDVEGNDDGRPGWLRSLGLGQYEATFRDNEIDSAVLPKLTVDDLKDLGVAVAGQGPMWKPSAKRHEPRRILTSACAPCSSVVWLLPTFQELTLRLQPFALSRNP